MSLSKKIKITSVITILGLLAFILVYFFQNRQNQDLKRLKQDFKFECKQAEGFKNVQLDSARSYAYKAYELVNEEPSLEFEKNVAILTLSEIEFLRSGASDQLFRTVEDCENWFRKRKMYDELFRSNLLRLKIKSFLKGKHNVTDDIDNLIQVATMTNSNQSLAEAYYFKMDQRDYSRKWEDDVHILDSARLFSTRAGDSVLLSQIRMKSVLPLNGSQVSKDSTVISLQEAVRWGSRELKCITANTMAMRFYTSRQLDTALFYLHNGLNESQKWKSQVLEMYAVYGISEAYVYSSKLDSAKVYLNQALDLAEKVGNSEAQIDILYNLSVNLIKREEYSKAIEFTMKSLDLSEKINYKAGIFSIQQSLVGNLFKTERYDEADKIINEMFKFQNQKESNYVNDMRSAEVHYLKGQTKFYKEDFDSALYHLHSAHKLLSDRGVEGRKSFLTDLAIFKVLVRDKRISAAEEHFNYMSSTYNAIYLNSKLFKYREGTLMAKLGQDEKAINALEKSLKDDPGITTEQHYETYILLSELYEKRGEFARALVNNKKGIEVRDEIDKKKDELKLEKLQSQYKIAEKESEIQQLDIERLEQKNYLESQENTLQRRKLFIILLSALLVLLIVIVVFIYRRSKEVRIREELKRKGLEQERELERLKTEESERTIELKNQLFANISHEFRTPLTLINAPVEELMEKVDDENKNSLRVVKRNADHLLVMVDEILELAKLDSGNTTLSRKELSLESFILKIRMNFEPVFRQNNIRLETKLPTENYTLIADEYRLKMVLNNILKNAFHHTLENGVIKINVTVNLEKERFEISIFNSGDWIDAEFLPTIFERYSRSKDKEYSGYGIGLSFCKEIISLHKGEIEAQNIDGGVLVSFTIPSTLREIESDMMTMEPEQITENSRIQPIQEGEYKLLIVEDNIEMQNLLKDLLQDQFELIFANDGQEGIEKAEQNQPDLIISDIMMPKVEGTELARTLKSNFSTSHIPIILLTAKSAGHDRITGLETGADDYLTKPFSPKELRVRVRNLIEQREKLKRRFSKNIFLIPEEITSNSLDQEFLVKATEIVESNLDNPEFSVEAFCRKLTLNRNSVHQKLKSLTGSSASQFIKSIKLKKAAIFLADGRISIVEVSELSGFNNRPTFNKAFKDQFEMTPSEYRTKCLSNKE